MPGIGFRAGTRSAGVKQTLPGSPGATPSPASSTSFIYESAQVEEIVQNETSDLVSTSSRTSNVGRVRIRFLNTEKGIPSSKLPWADPLIPYQTIFPLIGEHVLVFKMQDQYWYIGPLSIKQQLTENATALTGLAANVTTADVLARQQQARLGVTTQLRPNINQVGTNFKKRKINPLKPFEGDVIYQGRYGNSIRLGSSQMIESAFGEQYPNIIMRAGQGPNTAKTTDDGGEAALTGESINNDASSIWMVSNQILGIIPATFGSNIHLRSLSPQAISGGSGQQNIVFGGASILLNSDRLIFNSKATSIFMFAKRGIHLNSLDDGFTLDTSGQIILKTPSEVSISGEKTMDIMTKQDLLLLAKRDVSISGDRNVIFYGNEIYLGGSGVKAEPIVMAKKLKLFMYELLRTIMSTSPLTMGPSGIVNPALIARLLIVYSKYMVLPDPFNPLWASNDNFVMKSNEQTLSGPGFLPANEGTKRVVRVQLSEELNSKL